MRGYFGIGQLSASDKQDILNQHKSVYNGYQTMQPQVSNTQPLYVYDDISDKDGMVVNNKGEVKKYTNMGINEQVEAKEVCDECGSMIMDGMCTECNYGHMEESELDESNMCECGGEMYEGVCNECGYGNMEEETGHLDDIYNVRDLNLKKGDFDYVEGGGNDYGTFEGSHKKLYKEDNDMDFPSSDDDYMDYESSYTDDDMEDPDNEDDGFEDIQSSEMDEIDVNDLVKGNKYKYKSPARHAEIEFGDEHKYPESGSMYSFKGEDEGESYALGKKSVEDFIKSLRDEVELDEQGGNADDMDVDSEAPAFDFVSGGPNSGYNVNEDDMYGYEPEKDYGTMESAWDDDELEEDHVESPMESVEMDEIDVSGVQGIYGDMKKAYDFDSDGPGKAGPYQEFSYESELDEEDDFEEVDEDLKESLITQKNKINEMFNRFKKYN
mgnify:CR=1 FL=1